MQDLISESVDRNVSGDAAAGELPAGGSEDRESV